MFIKRTPITYSNRYCAVLALGLAPLAALNLSGCGSPQTNRLSTQPPITPVKTCEVKDISAVEQSEISGTLSAERESPVSAEVSARITSWPLKAGDKVRTGDVIAVLDQREVLTQLASAKALAAEAEADVAKLTAEYTKATAETLAQVQAAQADVDSARANERKVNDITRGQELRQAEARLSQSIADETLAKKELDRFANLVAGGAASRQTLDQVQARFDVARQARISAEQSVSLAKEGARTEDRLDAASKVRLAQSQLMSAQARPARLASISSAIKAAQAQCAAARANVAQLNVLLSKHVVRAPFTGRVLKTSAELGQFTGPGTPLITLGETSLLKLQFSVPESDRKRVKANSVEFTVQEFPAQTFRGQVTSRGFQADSRTRNFSFEATVDNPRETLLPGMVALVRLPVGHIERGVLVPLDALVMDGTKAEVYVCAGGRVERRRVLVEDRRGENALIGEGLRGGERVVLAPKGLADGQRVEVVR